MAKRYGELCKFLLALQIAPAWKAGWVSSSLLLLDQGSLLDTPVCTTGTLAYFLPPVPIRKITRDWGFFLLFFPFFSLHFDENTLTDQRLQLSN